MKALEKMTKEMLISNIGMVVDNYKNNLKKVDLDSLEYVLSQYKANKRKIAKEDIISIIETVEESTGVTLAEMLDKIGEEEESTVKQLELPVKENSKKPLKKKEEEKSSASKETKEKATKKQETKKVKHNTVEILATFPKELESTTIDNGVTLKLRENIKGIKDVVEMFKNGEDIVIATYWTKRHLKQYKGSYDPLNINPNKPAEFENDLDLVEITYANELVVTGVSLYTYVPQIFTPEDFIPDEDGLLTANGMEFAIYDIVPKESTEEQAN